MFRKKGTIVYAKEKISDFDSFFEAALEAGADDAKDDGGAYEVECAPETFSDLKEALDKLQVEADVAEVGLVPENYSQLDDHKASSLHKLVDILEDNDDVQNVFHNGQFPGE